MMSADDETQIEELDVNQNTSSKINDSFGLTTPLSTNASIKPPITIPSQSPANYFKPISTAPLSSSTLTSDVKQPIKLPDFSASINTQKSADSTDSSTKPMQPANNLFMMPNLSAMPTALISAPITLTTPVQSQVIQPPPPPPASSTTTNAPPLQPPKMTSNTLPSVNAFSPPTASTQPPIATTTQQSGGSSNPYSARGALNKKIYDQNQLSSVPVAAPASNILLPTIPNDQTAPTTNLYVPPPAPVQQPTSSSPTPQTSIQPPYQPLTQQPSSLPPPPTSAQVATGGYSTPFIPPSQSGPPTMQRYQESQDQSAFILTDQMASMSFNYPQDSTPNTSYNNKPQQKTPWNWLTQNKLINTLKTGVESLVTTIDPQMKEYIHNTNEHLYIINTSIDKCVSEAIRESFGLIGYLRLSVYDYDCRTSNAYAPQIVGHACAQQAIQEKLNNALQYVQQECIMIGVQDFIVELTQNSWFEHTCILLRDTKHNIEISVYTEGIPVPNELMQSVLQKTTDNYPLKWSGLASRIIENSNMEWYDMVYGLQRKTFITNSLKTLAYIYKSKSNSSSS